MPNLFNKIIALGRETTAFPLREYWLDIGKREDFEKANSEFGEVFG
jgi:NDP-sugar pyrophosphorylase family protein